MLRFRLLGPFEAFRDDERIPATAFRTRQARCALKLLLSEHGRGVAFTRLADTFWADADPDTARNSLHVAVRTLRRVLEPELERGAGSRFIKTKDRGYEFFADECAIDVDEFLAQRRAGRAAEGRGDARAAIDAYRSAAVLYRGEYIAEEPDAEWVLPTRERLREAFLETCERLAGLLAGSGHVTDAVAVIERGLQADPVREDLYLRLMGLHARAGRRGHALAAFERCRRVLRAQLGTEPGPAVRRLRDDVLSGAALGAAAADDERAAVTPASGFVGRERELAVIRDTWVRSERDAGHLVVVSGDAGAGKTRLVEQVVERLAPDARLVWLAASESGHDVPFGPLLASLAVWLDTATTREVERLGEAGPTLAYLLPQLRSTWPDCPPPAPTPPDRAQLLEAFATAVLVRARGRAVVVLDDAQWADEETLLWLGYQLHRAPLGILTVAVTRPAEGRAEQLERLRSDTRRRHRLTQVDVGPLTLAEVEHLLDQATDGAARGSALAGQLHSATRGNALFVVETIREIGRRGAAEAASLPIAANVRDAIVARLVALPPTARDVLGALAVVGAAAAAGRVADVAQLPLDDAIDALDILLARGLVTVRDDGRGYAIEHPIVSRVVYDRLGPARREQWLQRSLPHAPELASAAPISA